MVTFQPLFAWWIVAILCTVLVAATVWSYIRRWRDKLPLWPTYVMVISAVSLIGIATGPSIPGGSSIAGMANLDIVFVIDRTVSMSALDYNGMRPRLDGVISDALKLQEVSRGARVSIITVDAEAATVLPFTNDSGAARDAFTTLDTESTSYTRGSSIDTAVKATVAALQKSQQQHPTRARLVYYFGDGEQTASGSVGSFAAIKPYISGGAVLGYGTTEGGVMRSYFGYKDLQDEITQKYVEVYDTATSSFVKGVSKINESNLRTIADQMGVIYDHRTTPEGSIDPLIQKSKMTYIADTTREISHYDNMYWVFAIILFVTWLWVLVMLVPLVAQLRRQRRVYDRKP